MRYVSDLVAGDEVLVVLPRYRSDAEVVYTARVARCTATQVVLDNGTRWRRESRPEVRLVGAKSCRDRGLRLVPMTDALRHRVEYERLVKDVLRWFRDRIDWHSFPIEKLRALHAAVEDLRDA